MTIYAKCHRPSREFLYNDACLSGNTQDRDVHADASDGSNV